MFKVCFKIILIKNTIVHVLITADNFYILIVNVILF